MVDPEFLTILGLGFLLGARHALEADHLAAVSTMVAGRPELRRSGLIGLWWGSGHTATLLIVGMAVLAGKVSIPEPAAQAFEAAVGAVLVWLGVSLGVTIWRERWHVHVHRHDDGAHVHLHRHQDAADHQHEHWTQRSVRPFMVGMAHGLAGSAALTLMVLSTVRTAWEGAAYIAVFGAGSIIAMAVVGVLLTLPLTAAAPFGRLMPALLQGCASIGSIGLGLSMMVRIALGT